jgi:predicted ATP-dependent endonuclease of OLD family
MEETLLESKKVVAKTILDYWFELFTVPPIHYIFSQPKKKNDKKFIQPILSYEKFEIYNFKGIDKAEVNLVKNDLVLLLGLNESGKSTILKAIESFDFLNDPLKETDSKYFQNIRNKSQVSSNKEVIVTSHIKIENNLTQLELNKLGDKTLSNEEKKEINNFIESINADKKVTISRVFPFKEGKLSKYYYRIESKHSFAKNPLSRQLALEIVNICPFIIYFEDFKDRIPEKIYASEKSDSFDSSWFDIIDGLFYNTNEEYSIEAFRKYYSKSNQRIDDARTVLKRVNKTLNETFTKKWKNLSGVKDIESAELIYNEKGSSHFILKITDSDGTTFSVDERSRGALWYLSFLMKTEFRSKRMRKDYGKPVFLIDEPASNLHSTAQQNMIDDFNSLAKNTSIIYTTHSQYLISLYNIKNTYIIERDNSKIVATKWSEFLKRPKNKRPTTYYQPLANLLNIIPNVLDIPWKQCIITEGPSDRHMLYVMYKIIFDKTPGFAIYPGTSANDLDYIISLNIGWNANFKIILDSDKKGLEQQKRYIDEYYLSDKDVQTLPNTDSTIEDFLPIEERIKLYKLIYEIDTKDDISKKETASMFALLAGDSTILKKVITANVFSNQTLDGFKTIFKNLELVEHQ